MRKRSRKLVSILLTLALLATLLVPMATPAAAGAGTYSTITAPTVEDDGDRTLGKLKVTWEKDDVVDHQTLFFSLPPDFKYFPDNVSRSDVVAGSTARVVYLGDGSGTNNYIELKTSDNSAAPLSSFTLDKVSDNEFKVIFDGNYGTDSGDPTFYIDFKKVYVPAFDGDIKVNIEAASDSAFSDGSVVIGRTSGGEVTVSVVDTDTSNSDFEVTLRIKENVAGALKDKADSLKFILPDGYEWKSSYFVSYNFRNGDSAWDVANRIVAANFTRNADELTFDPVVSSGAVTTAATSFEVTLAFEVVDENEVQPGDVVMRVKGSSTVTPSTLVVGTYGDYSATVKAKDAGDLPTVYAGKVEQEISDIVIKESIAGSLANNRYIKLELPTFARWTSVPNTVTSKGVTLTFAGIAGSEGNVIKYNVSGTSTSAAELELEDLEVLLDVTAPGDLKVKVSGNAGVEGEIAVAKIAPSVTAKATSKPEVKIGVASQKIGDVVITELEAGAISDGVGKYLVLKVPQGVEIAKLPKVEVTSGDLKIDKAGIYRAKPASTDFYQLLYIPIENDSNEASTITVSDLYVTVDRTVAEGDLKVAVLGSAILESNGTPQASWFSGGISNGKAKIDGSTETYSASSSLFPATAAYTAAAAAVVSTPAPADQKINASFVIGSTTYKVGGVDQAMDVAPYIKDGRTYLPVRYVARALGVADANILWDQATKKVTLIKGNTFVQLTIGSNVMMVNGMPITMDVAPEITSDRTMLPIRFVAQVLGANVGWDEATQTVTLNN